MIFWGQEDIFVFQAPPLAEHLALTELPPFMLFQDVCQRHGSSLFMLLSLVLTWGSLKYG